MRFSVLCIITLFCVASCKEVSYYNIENELYKSYLDETFYEEQDHLSSTVAAYCETSVPYRKDRPAPVTLKWKTPGAKSAIVYEKGSRKEPLFSFSFEQETDSVNVWNLVPGHRYQYRIKAEKQVIQVGSFIVEGPRRMVYVDDNVRNVRDLGGLKTEDGRSVRYGILYRGAQLDGNGTKALSGEGKAVMRDFLGITADVDLRGPAELNLKDEDNSNDIKCSALGPDIAYVNVPIGGIDNIHKEKRLGEAYKAVLELLRGGHTVYFHCVGGADRTGILAMMVELSVGVCSDEVLKDYETTSFSKFGIRARDNDTCQARKGFQRFYSLPGGTMSQIAVAYLLSHGVTADEIEEMKSLILE